MLYEEPRNFLKEKLREPAIYNAIIEAIAQGASKLNEISTKTGLSGDKCAKYIRSLTALHILKREVPAMGKNVKKGLYTITDNYFNFWYRYVFENIDLIERDDGEELYQLLIEDTLTDYIGRNVFEDICMEYLWDRNKARSLSFVFSKMGRWWGTDSKTRAQVEIDILATHRKNAIFGECKWRNEPIDMGVVKSLQDKSNIFHEYEKKILYFFSRSGFTSDVKDLAAQDLHIQLVDLNELAENVSTIVVKK
jgi:AAA+ ATPase superfamily predicted ATPase